MSRPWNTDIDKQSGGDVGDRAGQTQPSGPARRRSLSTLLAASMLALLPVVATPASAGAYEDFFKALQLDLPQSIKKLLERGFDPNSVDPVRRDPALIYAVRFQSPKSFALLLTAPQIDIEARAQNGDTALMVAAYKGETAMVAALLEKGAEPNRPGWTALHYAAASGSIDIVKMLLEKSAYIDAAAPNKTTPLMMAAAGGKTDVVRLLIEEGADRSLKNDVGMTAEDFARKFADVSRPDPNSLPGIYTPTPR